MPIDFSRLLPLGWSNFFSTQIPLEALDRVRPARVVRVERDRYGVDAGEGEFFATLAGRKSVRTPKRGRVHALQYLIMRYTLAVCMS